MAAMVAMRRLAASLRPRIPQPPQCNPRPHYLKVLNKIAQMKEATPTKDTLDVLQVAEGKALKHYIFMHKLLIKRLPVKGLLRDGLDWRLHFVSAISLTSAALLIGAQNLGKAMSS